MVIDLELCSSAPLRLPHDYSQKDWDPSTTEPDGLYHVKYTTLSDMYQIGKMLSQFVSHTYSADAREMVAALQAKQLSAGHEWLREL
jgi:hypothetical protein